MPKKIASKPRRKSSGNAATIDVSKIRLKIEEPPGNPIPTGPTNMARQTSIDDHIDHSGTDPGPEKN